MIRVSIDRDVEGWRPEKGQTDVDGNLIEDREYDRKDFDRTLIIDERTKLIAKRITAWLKQHGRDSKTIIFCTDIDHAERMRQAMVNENNDIVQVHPDYIMRITGDNKVGKDKLDYFIDANEPYPTIVTTSKLMTTGVDCKTCKLIVLESNIQSMTEFKQIIGRGTRLNTEHDKWFFTIMDFRDVSRLFADKDFDPESPRPTKIRVRGIEVTILNERVQILDTNGNLVTESLTDFTKRNILDKYATLDDFIQAWQSADKK